MAGRRHGVRDVVRYSQMSTKALLSMLADLTEVSLDKTDEAIAISDELERREKDFAIWENEHGR